jgi:alpha-ketoglutarate-dependent taurine dioxygenase
MANTTELQPIKGPLHWRATDYPDDRSWVMAFDDAIVAEVEGAARNLLGHDAPLHEAANGMIPLPRTDEFLQAAYRDLETGRGFAVLSGLPVADWGLALSRAALCMVGTRFGRIKVQNRERDYLLDVINKNVTVSKTFRGYHGNHHLDFHNDGANAAALLCMEIAAEGGDTLMVSAATLYNEILTTRPDLMPPLLRGFHHHRRNQREDHDPLVTPYRAPVFSFIDGVFHSCYSRISIESTREEGVEFSALEDEALGVLDALLQRPELQVRTRLQKGDIQLMNNFTVLHARTSFIDKPGHPRHLLRLWLDDPNSRYNGPNKMDFYVPEESRFLNSQGYEKLAAE